MSYTQPAAAQLKASYDPEKLRAEMHAIGHSRFAAQRTYDETLKPGAESEVDWRVLPLRSPAGSDERTDPGGPGLDDYGDTSYLREAPYLASILAALPTRLRAARLMSLGPGAKVDEHRDYPYGLPAGWVRMHVPVVTNPDAVLGIAGVEHRWQPGTLWYGDFSQPHYVINTGSTRRVHLLIDAFVNRELLELFPAEFTEKIRWSEVMLDRPELPLGPADLAEVTRGFDLPKAFLWGEKEELDDANTPVVPARTYLAADGALLMEVDGTPQARLVHIGEGEFNLAGWTAERTVKFDLAANRIRFRMRFGSELFETVRACHSPAQSGVSSTQGLKGRK